MRVVLIPMHVEVGNFEVNWTEFERRFSEASGVGLYDEIVGRVSKLAKENGVYVIFGLIELYKNCVYNSALLIGRNGEVLPKHRKFQEPYKFCTGNTVRTAWTEFGKVAVIICGDPYNKR